MGEAPPSAFIAFLHCEAKSCEERAKSLRATANAIEAKGPAPSPTSPVKKRKREEEKPKRVHLAYAEFIKVNIDQFKKSHPDVPAREVVSIMSRQWANTSEEEKNIWRFRAEQLEMEHAETNHEHAAAAAAAAALEHHHHHHEELAPPVHHHHHHHHHEAEKPASLKDNDEILAEV